MADMEVVEEAGEEKHYLQDILSHEEITVLSSPIVDKINKYFSDYIKSKDVQTSNDEQTEKREMDAKLSEITKKYEEAVARLTTDQGDSNRTEDLIHEIVQFKEKMSQLESEKVALTLRCDNVTDEKNSIQQILKRRDNELNEYKSLYDILSKQLKDEMVAKCEAIALTKEVEGKQKIMKQKEATMDEEKHLLTLQISLLSEEVNKLTNESHILQIKYNNNEICWKKKMEVSTEDLNMAKKTITQLKEVNTKLMSQIEDLSEKLLTQKDVTTKIQCDYMKEINTKCKLVDIYKMLSAEYENKNIELNTGVTDLQKMVNEATEKYGELETDYRRLQMELEETKSNKDISYSFLETELEQANEQLKQAKDQNAQEILRYLSPSAAVVRKVMKSESPLSHVYSELVRVSKELKEEKERSLNLTNEVGEAVQQIAVSMPKVNEEKEEHAQMLENYLALREQLDTQISECKKLKNELNETKNLNKFHMRENASQKIEIAQLGKQVCYLLKEMNARGCSMPNGDTGPSQSENTESSDDITFGDIQELQRTNRNLLRQLNDLKGKHTFRNEDELNKIITLESKIADLTEQHHQHIHKMSVIIKQKEMYKALYHENMSSNRNEFKSIIDKASADTTTIIEIKQKLEIAEQMLKEKEKEYHVFRQEKINNEKLLHGEMENMRKDILELTTVNCQHATTAVYRNEQIKLLNIKLEETQKEASTLKERVEACRATTCDYEMIVRTLTANINSEQEEFAKTQQKVEKNEKEMKFLMESMEQLKTENTVLKNELEQVSLKLRQTEIMKIILENINTEKCKKLEVELEESTLNCVAVQKRLEEEHDRFRKLTVHLESELSTAKTILLEERDKSESLKKEILIFKADLEKQNATITELQQKLLQQPISNTDSTNNDSTDLHNIVQEKDMTIKLLDEELLKLKETLHKGYICSQNAEEEYNNLKLEYDNYKTDRDAAILEYKKQICEVQKHCTKLEMELLQRQGQSEPNSDVSNELTKVKNELCITLNSLKSCQEERDNALRQLKKFSDFEMKIEERYAQEVLLHSADIQALEKAKQQNELDKFTILKYCSSQKVESDEETWTERERMLKVKNSELLETVDALKFQNAELHDQTIALTAQLSAVFTSNPIETVQTTGTENPLENAIATTKHELLHVETDRLKSQLENVMKELEDTKLILEENRFKFGGDTSAAMKQADILRKIETLDALSDSNRALRAERDSLANHVVELTTSVKTLQDELSPLHEKISEISSKSAALESANVALKEESERWKNRVNSLIENANKTSPEDWKQLENNCEQLTAMLHAEKENSKKIHDELEIIKMNKSKFESMYVAIFKEHTTLVEEHQKLNESFQTKVNAVESHNKTITSLRTRLDNALQKVASLKAELSDKEKCLADVNNKEMKVRNIARKYKIQYQELVTTVETEKITQNKNEVAKIKELQHCLDTERAELEKLKSDLKLSVQKEDKAKQLLKTAKEKITQITEAKAQLATQLDEAKKKIESIEHTSQDEEDSILTLIKSQYEGRISKLSKEKEELQLEKTKEIETLIQKINQQRPLPSQPSEKSTTEPPTANIKPMAAASSGASTSSSRRSGEPPLASIRPVAQVQAMPDTHSTEYMPASSSRPLQEEAHPPPQTVALVIPRVEPPSTPGPSVSTSHAAAEPRVLKRPRPSSAANPYIKKTKTEEEYQMPTSSHQEDEGFIVVEIDNVVPVTYEARTAADVEEQEQEVDGQEVVTEAAAEESSEDEPEASVVAAPQIEAISSGTEPSGTLSLGGGDDDGGDGIVPSTPTLYVPRRNDGFGEAVVSPLNGADGARFTFTQTHHHTHAELSTVMPPALSRDFPQTETDTRSDDTREAEASTQSSNTQQSNPTEDSDSRGRGRLLRGWKRGFRRPHGYTRF